MAKADSPSRVQSVKNYYKNKTQAKASSPAPTASPPAAPVGTKRRGRGVKAHASAAKASSFGHDDAPPLQEPPAKTIRTDAAPPAEQRAADVDSAPEPPAKRARIEASDDVAKEDENMHLQFGHPAAQSSGDKPAYEAAADLAASAGVDQERATALVAASDRASDLALRQLRDRQAAAMKSHRLREHGKNKKCDDMVPGDDTACPRWLAGKIIRSERRATSTGSRCGWNRKEAFLPLSPSRS